jgi:protein-tyrosine phosphatase
MAEAVFTQMVKEEGLEDAIEVDSAGTGGWHVGEKAHEGTRAILRKHDIPYDGRSRKLAKEDLHTADYLIAMDRSNKEGIERLGDTDAHVSLLLDYATNAEVREVPDPYYQNNFDFVYELVTDGARGLLEAIKEEHKL